MSSADNSRKFAQLKRDLHARLVSSIDMKAFQAMAPDVLRRELRRGAEELCRVRPDLIGEKDRQRIIEELMDEVLGLGPLEPLLRDPSISDILVNGAHCVYVERAGRLERAEIAFDNEEQVMQIVRKIAGQVGRRIDESSPMVDARLSDGSRVNAIIRPVALDGALVSIRRFAGTPLTPAQLVANGALTQQMLDFLSACIAARLNIVISGGTGGGKTTLLNALSSFISPSERIVTIEDAAELQLRQPHVARMETRPANIEGVGDISARDLVRNALRMRPDRIIVGECRAGEAFDMLQAMNTGHDGSLTTVHANTAADALSRLEMLIGMAGVDIPPWLIGRQIASAIHLVIEVTRFGCGSRKVTQIAEVTGCDAKGVQTQNLFTFEEQGVAADGATIGQFVAHRVTPKCINRLTARGKDVAGLWETASSLTPLLETKA